MRAQLMARLEPEIVPMGLLRRVDTFTERDLSTLGTDIAAAVVDSTLGYVRNKVRTGLL